MQNSARHEAPGTELFPFFKAAFWKRQFETEPTAAQQKFDWLFGVLLPVACVIFDPLIFKGAISHHGAVLGEYKPFAYLLSFVSIVLMMLFLLYRRKLGWFNAALAGLFIVGAAVSTLVGILILPFSLLGLVVLIGFLGFTPLLAAFVYFRNAIRAVGYAELAVNDVRLFGLFAVSAVISFVLPYVFYSNVEAALREMESGNPSIVREYREKLRYVAPFINVDRLALKSCGETTESRAELRNAVYELSGMNADRINRQYCYDW